MSDRGNEKRATFIKRLSDWKGDARLFKLSEPTKYEGGETEYVVVSAAVALFSGPETYIFPANDSGEVADWGELDGSFQGDLDHERALRRAGFHIEEGERA